jgi:hypothetical protein
MTAIRLGTPSTLRLGAAALAAFVALSFVALGVRFGVNIPGVGADRSPAATFSQPATAIVDGRARPEPDARAFTALLANAIGVADGTITPAGEVGVGVVPDPARTPREPSGPGSGGGGASGGSGGGSDAGLLPVPLPPLPIGMPTVPDLSRVVPAAPASAPVTLPSAPAPLAPLG